MRVLHQLGQETHLILTESAKYNIALETGGSLDEVCDLATEVHKNSDFAATVAYSHGGRPHTGKTGERLNHFRQL